MKPRGLLMIEHRLIEKMIGVIKHRITEFTKTGTADPVFIDTAVDFIRTYADRTHHGKEEDILFRDCHKKNLTGEEMKVMHELIDEHKFGRKIVSELVDARKAYAEDGSSLGTITEKLNTLVEFYPKHIEKEDKLFFPDSEKYFTEAELQEMLREFHEFDQTMIHEKYRDVVEELT